MEKLPKDKEHLVLDNLNMVHHILQKQMHIYPNHQSYQDYFQEGVIGLILSAIRFDESRGFKFSTFAFPNICGMIQRYRRDCEAPIKYSRKIKDVIFKVIQYSSQGYTIEEIEDLTGITSSEVQDALNVTAVTSMDATVQLKGEDTVHVSDMVADQRNSYEELMEEAHVFESIQKVSETITNFTYRGIWEEYIYGLFYGEKLGQQYFASKYNLSQSQVSRVLRKYKKAFVELLKAGGTYHVDD